MISAVILQQAIDAAEFLNGVWADYKISQQELLEMREELNALSTDQEKSEYLSRRGAASQAKIDELRNR